MPEARKKLLHLRAAESLEDTTDLRDIVKSGVCRYSSWTVGDEQYALVGGCIYRGFQNTRTSAVEAEGVLTRNGVAIGGLAVEDSFAQVDIVLIVEAEKTVPYSELK